MLSGGLPSTLEKILAVGTSCERDGAHVSFVWLARSVATTRVCARRRAALAPHAHLPVHEQRSHARALEQRYVPLKQLRQLLSSRLLQILFGGGAHLDKDRPLP